jgi:hypothetical protein
MKLSIVIVKSPVKSYIMSGCGDCENLTGQDSGPDAPTCELCPEWYGNLSVRTYDKEYRTIPDPHRD